MIRRLGHFLLILALLAMTGGHWALLQSMAWTNMLADHLLTDSFTTAIVKTFDGQHPCCLCKVIKEGRKSQKKSDFPSPMKQTEFVSAQTFFLLEPPQRFRLPPECNLCLVSRRTQPPVPPPRHLSV